MMKPNAFHVLLKIIKKMENKKIYIKKIYYYIIYDG